MKKNSVKNIERGDRGYLKQRKIKLFCYTVLMLMIGVLIFLVGFFLNKKEVTNIFTVVAFVMVLPATKWLVQFLIVMPFGSVSEEKISELKTVCGDGDRIFYDSVFTSEKYVMHLELVVIAGKNFVGYTGKKSDKIVNIEKTINDEYAKRQIDGRVLITDDMDKAISFLEKSDSEKRTADKNVVDMFKSFIV